MRDTVKKITESFPNHRYDMETTKSEWIIFFWKKNIEGNKTFFFELSDVSPKVKILINSRWETFEDENIEILIKKTQEIIG